MKNILKHVKPWHYFAGAGGLLALYLLGKKSSPSGPWDPSSPAEGYAPLESEAGCDLTVKPGTDYFRRFVLQNFGGYDAGILRDCSIGGDSGHKNGKSWDWGVDRGPVDVDGLLSFLQANDNEVIRRAGLMYFIYDQRIWNTRAQDWQNYTGADPHTSHVHFSFGTPGAYGETSFYQGA